MTPTVVDSHSHIFNADDIPIDGFLKHKLRIPALLTATFSGPLDRLASHRAPGAEEAGRLIELIQRAIEARESGLESIPGDHWEGAVGPEEVLTDQELEGRLIASLAAQQPVSSDGRPGLEMVGGFEALGDVDLVLEQLVAGASPEQLAELVAWTRERGGPDAGLEGFTDVGKIVRELKLAVHRLRETLRLISQPRHLVMGELARTYGDVRLFVPALVDFDLTAHDEPAMAVHRQISMHSLVAKLSIVGGIPEAPDVRVHPFVAFCPYREILHSELHEWDLDEPNPYVPYGDPVTNAAEDRFRRDLHFDPARARDLTEPVGPWKSATLELEGVTRSLDLVRHAIELGGFSGVKLYPPSGFRPIGNTMRFGERLGTGLDTALRALYRYCEDLGVPILTHASCSNGFERGWNELAAPAGWAEVLKDYPRLRLCFGHFGHLQGAKESDRVPPPPSWPMQYLSLMDAYDHVYADVGCSRYTFDDQVYGPRFDRFLREILSPIDGADATQQKRRRRLMFGSDYWMNTLAPGHEAAYDRFSTGIESHFGRATLDHFRGGNALRWLGFTDGSDRVDPGSASRERLVSFYTGQDLPPWLSL